MILCGICHKWQHAACFGLLEEETVPELHVCEMCGMVCPSSSYYYNQYNYYRVVLIHVQILILSN